MNTVWLLSTWKDVSRNVEWVFSFVLSYTVSNISKQKAREGNKGKSLLIENLFELFLGPSNSSHLSLCPIYSELVTPFGTVLNRFYPSWHTVRWPDTAKLLCHIPLSSLLVSPFLCPQESTKLSSEGFNYYQLWENWWWKQHREVIKSWK